MHLLKALRAVRQARSPNKCTLEIVFWSFGVLRYHFLRSPPGWIFHNRKNVCVLRCCAFLFPDVSYGPKRLVFWSSFSQSWGSLVSFLDQFSIIGGTLGALGPTFNIKKWIGPPKVPQEAKPRKWCHFWVWLGSHFLNIFRFVGVCF